MSSDHVDILVLDGGLGTTLEDVFHHDISSPLWSAQPVEHNPELIIGAHTAFLDARADIILTATYQSSFETFERAGYSRADAERLMLKAVDLAAQARARYIHDKQGTAPRIALSLGPFGATLSPAQEFSGFYPPPYGPRGHSAGGGNTAAFPETDAGRREACAAEDALAAFHLARLRVFAGQRAAWAAAEYVAFETVPLAREVRAVRRAMGVLAGELRARGQAVRPWWVCTVWPDGAFPEEGVAMEGVVDALLGGAGPVPWGIGINCTSPERVGALLERMAECVGRRGADVPCLVVYPNRGDVYEPSTRTWRQAGPQEGWAGRLHADIARAAASGVWRQVIVGGCCKTGPAEIAALAMLVKQQ
ncbi:Homocysteine S-methyltransferase [Wolfiporia cocos MD-104 SS10]|uniref:Homocysteine S-methyltransferase n=1 Tax=Wolfiporia cocos (strain MD-104) TaxID=742152 RepID=A0A2H3JIL3_WOLCO|nr:Homocysteine S-methyltransferase [Wolfiporia cocos MD-104 SS10]